MRIIHQRPYHPFATKRTTGHLIGLSIIIFVPLLFLLLFSYVAKISLPSLFENLGISLFRMGTACIISIVLGWLLAVFFYKGKRGDIALPVFDILQSFPISAILPIAVFYLGSSGIVVIMFLVLEIIWPILFSILSSLKLIRRDFIEAVKVSGISGLDYLHFFLIPVTTPGLITGTIIGLGNGWESLVATEIIVHTRLGLGNFFNAFSSNPQVTLLGILAFLAVIFSINKSIWLPLLEWSHNKMEE